MTEIVDGELIYNETSINSNGGTELMARRLVNTVDPDLLKGKQIIFSRPRKLEPNLKKIFYAHDLATDPEVAKFADNEYRSQFEKIVFVSNWQQHTYNMVLGIPFSQSQVISNAIEPIQYSHREPLEGRPIKLIYHTTPHRGLELLVPVFKYLREKDYNIELDVYSSFKAYGWEERDNQYKSLFSEMENIEGINNHGYVSNDEIRTALQSADIFAYPNIWLETSCLALIEALCAGVTCLHSNLGALPETSCKLSQVYMFDEDKNAHANKFAFILANLINQTYNIGDTYRNVNAYQSEIANTIYNVKHYTTMWNNILRVM